MPTPQNNNGDEQVPTDQEIAQAVDRVASATAAAPKGDVKRVVKALPDGAILQIAHLSLLSDGYAFMADSNGDKIFNILKKHPPTRQIYDALDLFRQAYDVELANPPPGNEALTTEPGAGKHDTPSNANHENSSDEKLKDGFKTVEKRVQLKSAMKWEDLVQMRRSRSAYLGRRFGNLYATAVVDIGTAPPVEKSVLQIAESIVLSEKGIEFVDGLGRATQYDPAHPLSKAAVGIVDSLKARGIDPRAMDDRAHELLCWTAEGNKSFVPSDMKSNSTPKPAQTESNSKVSSSDEEPGDENGIDIEAANAEADAANNEVHTDIDSEVEEAPPPPKEIDGAAMNPWHLPISATAPEILTFAAKRLTTEQISEIHSALKYLASNDDQAVTKDGKGFSRADWKMGHALAEKNALSPMEASMGRMLVLYYSRQLTNHVRPKMVSELRPALLKIQKEIRIVDPASDLLPSMKPDQDAKSPSEETKVKEPSNAPASTESAESVKEETPTLPGMASPVSEMAPTASTPKYITLTKKADKIRIGGRVANVSNAELEAIKSYLKQGTVTLLGARVSGDRLTHIEKIMVNDVEVNLEEEIRTAIDAAGVPTTPREPTVSPTAVDRVTETVEALHAAVSPSLQDVVAEEAIPASSTAAARPACLEDGTRVPIFPESVRKLLDRRSPDPDIG
jgi:hypothetical protein